MNIVNNISKVMASAVSDKVKEKRNRVSEKLNFYTQFGMFIICLLILQINCVANSW